MNGMRQLAQASKGEVCQYRETCLEWVDAYKYIPDTVEPRAIGDQFRITGDITVVADLILLAQQ
jgi:hypothetical protein